MLQKYLYIFLIYLLITNHPIFEPFWVMPNNAIEDFQNVIVGIFQSTVRRMMLALQKSKVE